MGAEKWCLWQVQLGHRAAFFLPSYDKLIEILDNSHKQTGKQERPKPKMFFSFTGTTVWYGFR